MPGIARLREEAEVGEFKPLDHFHFLAKGSQTSLSLERSVGKHQEKEDDVDGEVYEKQARPSHGINCNILDV